MRLAPNYPRLLLAAAMNRTKPIHHRSCVDADDPAVRKTFLNDMQRTAVISVAEDRNNDSLVAYKKIRIARGKTGIMIAHVTRHWKRYDIGRSEERRVGKECR